MNNEHSDVICLSPDKVKVQLGSDLLDLVASGPLTKQPMSVPFRVVLVRKPLEWVVWYQLWSANYDDGSLIAKGSYSFQEGYYTTDFVAAVQEFCKRIDKPDQLRSMFRDTK
jgi:hypothetical protein